MGLREFKFFNGFTIDSEGIQGIIRTLQVRWTPEVEEELNQTHGIDVEEELTRLMSEEIAREIDNNIIETITRRINGGGNEQIITRNVNADYLQRYLNMGGNRA